MTGNTGASRRNTGFRRRRTGLPGRGVAVFDLILQLQRPVRLAEGHRFSDMLLLLAGVGGMAGPARSAFGVAVDMKKMEILFAVTKIGQRGCFLCLHRCRVMAGVAEREFVPGIAFDVESGGIFGLEHSIKIAAVRVMAAGTVFFLDRPVVIRVFFQEFCQTGENFAVILADTVGVAS